MRAPPILYGGFAVRLAFLVFGLFLCACGIVCFLESELGLPPWDVLHQGLAEQLDISFGAANLIVSVAVLVLSWALRAHIGLGTFLNALLIGVVPDRAGPRRPDHGPVGPGPGVCGSRCS